jgi:hypothetical protein
MTRNGTGIPPVGGWRTPHGRAAELGQTKVFEPVADGPRPVPIGAAAPIERRDDGTFTSEGARAAVRRRQEVEKLPDFGDRTQPWMPPATELEPFDGARRDLLTQRRQEIHELTGAVDSGVGAQLRAWAYIHAAGEYWASRFFGTGDHEAFERMVRAFKAASTEDAKLRDAAAWAAAARANQDDDLSQQRAAFQRQLAERNGAGS